MFDEYLLFVRASCPYCISAMTELKERNLSYKAVEIDGCSDEFIHQLKNAYGHESFPMVLGHDKTYQSYIWIGGSDKLGEFLNGEQEI